MFQYCDDNKFSNLNELVIFSTRITFTPEFKLAQDIRKKSTRPRGNDQLTSSELNVALTTVKLVTGSGSIKLKKSVSILSLFKV